MANATIIYACTPDGLAILTRPGTLPEWLPPRKVLQGQRVQSAWGEPGPPIRVLVVAGGELLLSENGGRTWEKVETSTPISAVFNLGEDAPLYAAAEVGGLLLSQDRGATWNSLPALPEEGRVKSLIPNSQATARAYMLLAHESGTLLLEGSLQDGEWRVLPSMSAQDVAQDTGTGNVYAATAEGVIWSVDRGESWTRSPQSPEGGTSILAIPGAANKPPALVVGGPGGLAVSPDGGLAWAEVELPHSGAVTALARDPERRDRLYAATGTGFLFESANRGQTWQAINAAPLSPISALHVVRF